MAEGGERVRLPHGMSEARVRKKLKNEHPTNERQLRRLLTQCHTVGMLREHFQSLDLNVVGYSRKRKDELVDLLIEYWRRRLAAGESHKSLPAVDIRSSISVSTVVP